MERILILLACPEFDDAKPALLSARRNAAEPSALTWGLALEEEPSGDAMAWMARLGVVHFLCPESDLWTWMPRLWHGEGHVLMITPAARLVRGWDVLLRKLLRACPATETPSKAVLTGFPPVTGDALGAFYPVGTEGFDRQGRLTQVRGTPLRFASGPSRALFLHPGFCFGPAGFFRAMAEYPAHSRFLRALQSGWRLYTPHRVPLWLQWDEELPPLTLGEVSEPDDDAFMALCGMGLRSRRLSARARRGMAELPQETALRVPVLLRAQEGWRAIRLRGTAAHPLCVTYYDGQNDTEEDTLRDLTHLTRLKTLALLVYAAPTSVGRFADIFPNVKAYSPRYEMTVPGAEDADLRELSKCTLLEVTRDRFLTASHYVWLAPDIIRFPLYERTALDWGALCGKKITLATVRDVPDLSMVCVPESYIHTLARELEARCAVLLNQRNVLPEETELWSQTIAAHPTWFQLIPLPLRGQLFLRTLKPGRRTTVQAAKSDKHSSTGQRPRR